MRNKQRKAITIAFLTILLIIVGWYLGAQHLHETSPIFNLFFSPSDLYATLDCSEFNISQQSKYSLNFINKYPGNHQLAVIVEKPTEISRRYDAKFKIILKISSENQELVNTQITEERAWPFWGIRKGSGFSIFTFKAPSDLPQGKPLKATVQVLEPDENFFSKYGKQQLCVSKYSDE